MEGYIKLYRKILDNGMITNHKLFTFWVWCLLKATHKKWTPVIGYQSVDLEPGQFIFGRKMAALELNMSERNIRTCLDTLKEMGNLAIKTTNKFSVVTICNWGDYQFSESENDQQMTSNRPSNDQQMTTNNNMRTEEDIIYLRAREETPASRFLQRFTPDGQKRFDDARLIIAYLNEKADKSFPDTYGGMTVIIDRLLEGKLPEQFRLIIDKKIKDPGFNRNWLRPETLFSQDNFDKYLYEEERHYATDRLSGSAQKARIYAGERKTFPVDVSMR